MLLFSSGTFTVDGITVFPDHANRNQYWYLPGPVGLEVKDGSTDPQFSLIMYTPDVAAAGIQGCGFLMTTLCLTLNPETESKIKSKIQSDPTIDSLVLSPVYFDEGSVQVVSLDLQGSGGTSQTDPGSGIGHAIQKILGTSTPELFGNNDALFELVLTEEGATILKAAFENNMTPVGGIYNLKFTGVQPALDVKITCDMKRAYQSFSVNLTADAYFVSAGIDATFEKLRQDGTIGIEIVSLINDATTAAQEQWALNLFKDQIMAQWFAPSLGPTTAVAADAQSVNVNAKGNAPTPASPTSTTTTQTRTKPTNSSGNTMQSTQKAGQMGGAQASQHAPAATAGMTSTTPPKPATTPVTSAPAAGATTPPPAATTAAAPASAVTAAGQPAAASAGQGAPAAGATATIPNPTPTPNPTPAPAGNSASTTTTTTAPVTPSTGAAVANAIGSVAGTAAGASSAASPFGVALRLKYVNQDELKTVEIEFNQMSAVQRTYSPQGYFGLMLAGLQGNLFQQVDGNNPFFTKFVVTLNPPKDFAGIGLQNVHAALDYGSAIDPTSPAPKHGEYNFDPANTTSQVWDIFEGNIQSNQYTYTVDYTFDPESGWLGDQLRYTLPATTTENRTLMLDPYSFLSFLEVTILANRLDANFVDRVEVALAFVSAGGWSTSQIVVVHPGNAPQSWKIRVLSDPSDPTRTTTYTQTSTCYLKDGTVIAGQPISSSATSIFVNDPFVAAMDIVLVPAFSPATWQFAYVEVTYQDANGNFNFNTTQQLLPGGAAVKVHIPVLDRRQMQFQYQVTMLGVSGQQFQGTPITTSQTQLLISAA